MSIRIRRRLAVSECGQARASLDHVVVAFGSGGTLAGLAALVAGGRIKPGDRTVLLHTGGLPGLFGHPGLPHLT